MTSRPWYRRSCHTVHLTLQTAQIIKPYNFKYINDWLKACSLDSPPFTDALLRLYEITCPGNGYSVPGASLVTDHQYTGHSNNNSQ